MEEAMTMGNSGNLEDHEDTPRGIRSVLQISGISHRRCLFNQYFVNYNEGISSENRYTHNVQVEIAPQDTN